MGRRPPLVAALLWAAVPAAGGTGRPLAGLRLRPGDRAEAAEERRRPNLGSSAVDSEGRLLRVELPSSAAEGRHLAARTSAGEVLQVLDGQADSGAAQLLEYRGGELDAVERQGVTMEIDAGTQRVALPASGQPYAGERSACDAVMGKVINLVIGLFKGFRVSNEITFQDPVGDLKRDICSWESRTFVEGEQLDAICKHLGVEPGGNTTTQIPCYDDATANERLLCRIMSTISDYDLEAAGRTKYLMTADDMDRLVECLRGLEHVDLEAGKQLQQIAFNQSGEAQRVYQGDILIPRLASGAVGLVQPSPGSQDAFSWHGGSWFHNQNVGNPLYCFSKDISPPAKAAFKKALEHIETKVGCTVFTMVSPMEDGSHSCREIPSIYVKSDPEDGCWSFVGRVSGIPELEFAGQSQPLNLGRGCETMGMAAHQVMHALGVLHQLSRSDRDSFIRLHTENMVSGIAAEDLATDHEPYTETTYDYLSLMNVGVYTFASENMMTFTPLDNSFVSLMGQRHGLSPTDVNDVAKGYCKPLVQKSISKYAIANLGKLIRVMVPHHKGYVMSCADATKEALNIAYDDATSGRVLETCDDLAAFTACQHDQYGQNIQMKCKKTCLHCSDTVAACRDEEFTGLLVNGEKATCQALWKATINCDMWTKISDLTKDVPKMCPKACGLCRHAEEGMVYQGDAPSTAWHHRLRPEHQHTVSVAAKAQAATPTTAPESAGTGQEADDLLSDLKSVLKTVTPPETLERKT